jgi:N-acetylneuraminate synthase
VIGSRAIFSALGGGKEVLPEEQPTIDFAYACVVSIRDIAAGEELSADNIWVKRPGTGEIKAKHFDELIGRRSRESILANTQLTWADVV